GAGGNVAAYVPDSQGDGHVLTYIGAGKGGRRNADEGNGAAVVEGAVVDLSGGNGSGPVSAEGDADVLAFGGRRNDVAHGDDLGAGVAHAIERGDPFTVDLVVVVAAVGQAGNLRAGV